jgi:tetrahydromethanopterin S-methyltransferase subunit G
VDEWWDNWAVRVDAQLSYLNDGFIKHEAYTQDIQGMENLFKEHIEISTRASLSDFQEAMQVEFQHQIEKMDQMQEQVKEKMENVQRKVEGEMLEFAQRFTGKVGAEEDQIGIFVEAQKQVLSHEVNTAYRKLQAKIDEMFTMKIVEVESLISQAEHTLEQVVRLQAKQQERLMILERKFERQNASNLDLERLQQLENSYLKISEEMVSLRASVQSDQSNSSNSTGNVHLCSQIIPKLDENFSQLLEDFLSWIRKWKVWEQVLS